MALGFDVDSILAKLAENPAIKQVISQVTDVCGGVVKAMTHFNNRFDVIEAMHKENSAKLDKLLFSVEHRCDTVSAGDDGLMKMLAESGEEMRIQEVEPMTRDVNEDGSSKTKIN